MHECMSKHRVLQRKSEIALDLSASQWTTDASKNNCACDGVRRDIHTQIHMKKGFHFKGHIDYKW